MLVSAKVLWKTGSRRDEGWSGRPQASFDISETLAVREISNGNTKELIEVAKLSDTMYALMALNLPELGNDSAGVLFYETNDR